MSNPSPSASLPAGQRVTILYNRFLPAEERLAHWLEQALRQRGFPVSTDQGHDISLAWATELESHLSQAHALIPLISCPSHDSESLIFELEFVRDAAPAHVARPLLLPVKVQCTQDLPDALTALLQRATVRSWDGPADSERLLSELCAELEERRHAPPPPAPTAKLRIAPRTRQEERPVVRVVAPPLPGALVPPQLEAVGGAVPLNSEFYIERPQDLELRAGIQRYDSLILIKGARQMGKTSLMARGLQRARERGAKVILTDFQKFNSSELSTLESLYLLLSQSLAEQLDLEVDPATSWDERRGPNANFERFVRKEVLEHLNTPLVWGLDETDRLFTCAFGSEVFGLFRSWHNERALDPSGPWSGLSLVLAYATEAHLFISDMNQSPFNVGTRLVLGDFEPDQVAELNRRYRHPLPDDHALERFYALVGGHPYLVRRGLHELTTRKLALADFEAQSDRDDGIYGDHLRRILMLLAKDTELRHVLLGVLRQQAKPSPEAFFRLRSSGVVQGSSPDDVQLRCQLYQRYLTRHLR